jgi:hypothetical protein
MGSAKEMTSLRAKVTVKSVAAERGQFLILT